MTEAYRSFQPTEATVPLWASLLANYEPVDCQAALVDYLRTERFAPVPADIISRIERIRNARNGAMSPDRLWRICFSIGSQLYARGALDERLRNAGVPEFQIRLCERLIRSLGVARLQHLEIDSDDYSWARKDFLRAMESESAHSHNFEISKALEGNSLLKSLMSNVKTIQ